MPSYSLTPSQVKNVFENITRRQKASVINLLMNLAVSDGNIKNQSKEMNVINKYIDILDIRFDYCMEYFNIGSYSKMISDLNELSKKQREQLALVAWEMIVCDGRPNEKEINATNVFFNQMGISEDEFLKLIK